MHSDKALFLLFAVVFVAASLLSLRKPRSSRKGDEKNDLPWTGDGDGGLYGRYPASGDYEATSQGDVDGCSSDGGFDGGDCGDGGGGD